MEVQKSVLSSLTGLDYFTKILEDNLKAVVKPQYVDQIPRAVKGPVRQVGELIKARAQMDNLEHILDVLGWSTRPSYLISLLIYA